MAEKKDAIKRFVAVALDDYKVRKEQEISKMKNFLA